MMNNDDNAKSDRSVGPNMHDIIKERSKMIESTKAGDVMVPLEKYPHIPYWFTIRQAMAELAHSSLKVMGRQSLPRFVLVFDEKYRLMGVVRRRDLLRGLEPEFLLDKSVEERRKLFDHRRDPVELKPFIDKVIDATKERADRKVSEIMQPIDWTVDYNDHIFQVIYDMNVNEVSMLPVMQDGHVVGVVRSVDVFYDICSFIL